MTSSSDHGTPPDLPHATPDDSTLADLLGYDNAEDVGDYCRICRGEGSREQPLFYPCKCSGSIRFVHQECLMEWLAHSKKKYCELCKTPFRFTKLYDKSMPAILPVPLFLKQLVLYFVATLTKWARYVFVASVWSICLPWAIRQVWRGLFWLADGSWVSQSDLRPDLRQDDTRLAGLKESNMTNSGQGTQNVTTNGFGALLNWSTYTTWSYNTSSGDSLVTMTLRFITGESLVSKIFRFPFSLPPLHMVPSTSMNQTHVTSTRRMLQRPVSLLSDVKVVKSLSTSPLINHLMLDVLEGILICLALVAGFILIFLIREWVINQQPMLNIPDADIGENPPAPIHPHANEVRPILRHRRRRNGPRAADPAVQAGENADPPDQQPLPLPPPQRAMTDDNIAVPASSGFEQLPLLTRSQSDVTTWPEPETPHTEDRTSPPPPLVRGAIGEVVNVHRMMEEAPIPSDERVVHHPDFVAEPEMLADPDRLQDVNELATYRFLRSSTPVVQFAPGVEVIGTSDGQSPENADSATQSSSDSGSPVIPTPDSSEEEFAEHIPGQYAQGADETFDSHAETIETTDDTEDNATESEDSPNEVNESATEPEDLDLTHPPTSRIDRLGNWLWQVEGRVPPPVTPDMHDEVHVIADVQAEAPFVPVHNRVLLPGEDVLHVPAPPANLEQALDVPNVPQNREWNDANAVEEIEDLEGVLELIGMEGPLVGMMQNVIFSLFLITVTLTASIWIPYIWGKITLLLLAHPIIVLVKAPIFIISNAIDLIADLVFFVLGILGLTFNNLTKAVKALTAPVFPPFSRLLNTELFEELSLNVTHQSGSRLEKTLATTFLTLSPDLPAFSIQSHRALMSFKMAMKGAYGLVCVSAVKLYHSLSWPSFSYTTVQQHVQGSLATISTLPSIVLDVSNSTVTNMKSLFSVQLKPLTMESKDIVLVDWSTEDKIIAIFMGYLFFFFLGYVFLRVAHFALGLKKDEKVEGSFADGFRQATGVLKVIIIIGIEMIVFPLYCGLLLDLALLPLFEGATIQTRLAFIRRAPFTGLFLHWFVGTCYMFHFALFVSICRKILRKGVLYFIRDPDDPTFHPVRDVLERPVPTQLGKIAFSALVYGGLVIMCLGGVVWGIGHVDGVLPIRWSTPEPRLAFPADVIFFNFMLPYLVRKLEPSKKLSTIYEWWFRGCAHGLRLTQFLFGEEREDEKTSRRWFWNRSPAKENGTYVRVPASDSCRIPKDKDVFLEVSENNERLDGQPEVETGLYGKSDERWTKVYLPPQFRARVATFVVLLWLFAAGTGVSFSIGPLLAGRKILKWVSGSPGPVNDLYAFTVGTHLLAGFAYVAIYSGPKVRAFVSELKTSSLLSDPGQNLPRVLSTLKYIAGMMYLLTAFGVVFPLVLSIIAELYVHIPVFTYLESRTPSSRAPTIFLLQSWTLGLLYLRLAFRIALNYPCPHTRLANAIRMAFHNGYLHPDIRLASRAIILPLTALCIVLLATPTLYASVVIVLMHVDDTETKLRIHRLAFPGLLGLAVTAYGVMVMKRRLDGWRVKIRDEVYLVGERLHNYADKRERRRLRKEQDRRKGKEAEKEKVSVNEMR